MMAKILIAGNNVMTLINFRKDLITYWVKSGHDVIAVAPVPEENDNFKGFAHENGYTETLENLGATFVPWKISRCGFNPFSEMLSIFRMIKILRKEKTDIVFSYNLKPNSYVSLSANFVRPKPDTFSLITGLGYAFRGNSIKQKSFSFCLSSLLQIALLNNNKIFFQNKDDRDLFLNKRIILSKEKTIVVNGTGVNLKEFDFQGPVANPITFTMISRMVWQKGVKEFIEAAKSIKEKHPDVRFLLVGPLSNNPDAITEEALINLLDDGSVDYIGPSDNVKEIFQKSSVFVLPSYYGEGIPRTILEAMATGLPIITTDHVGCKETVIHGENGFLVKPQDVHDLAKHIEHLIQNKDKLLDMGQKSRELAGELFDVNLINKSMTSQIFPYQPSKTVDSKKLELADPKYLD